MLNERISELRRSFNWTQVQLADKLNVSKQAVSNWENDNIQPSIEMLVKLSRVFNVSTDYLLGLDDTLKIDVSDLPVSFVAHLDLLIEDFRTQQK